jgi:predicted amidohydrolase
MVTGPIGEVMAVCSDDRMEEVVVADLSLAHLADVRERIPIRTERRPF